MIETKSFNLYWNGVEYGGRVGGRHYHFYWWNVLSRGHRHLGFEEMFYDGGHCSFGLWFVNLAWSSPWTNHDRIWDSPRRPWVTDYSRRVVDGKARS